MNLLSKKAPSKGVVFLVLLLFSTASAYAKTRSSSCRIGVASKVIISYRILRNMSGST